MSFLILVLILVPVSFPGQLAISDSRSVYATDTIPTISGTTFCFDTSIIQNITEVDQFRLGEETNGDDFGELKYQQSFPEKDIPRPQSAKVFVSLDIILPPTIGRSPPISFYQA